MTSATDQSDGPAFTYKELHRAWKSLPAHRKPYYDEWVQMFFARITFIRVLWNLRKKNHDKYLKIRRAEWVFTMIQFKPHRKMWRKYMAGYSNAREPE